MVLSLWNNEIEYNERIISLLEFSTYLEERAKRSFSDFLSIGAVKKPGLTIS